jgi:hypothetical protein
MKIFVQKYQSIITGTLKKLRNFEALKTLSKLSHIFNIEFDTMSMLKIKTLKTYSMSMSIYSMF